MNTDETIRAIQELGELMGFFAEDRRELVALSARMRVRLDQLDAQAIAGRPDLAARLREQKAAVR